MDRKPFVLNKKIVKKPHKTKRGYGKQKGGEFERVISKALSLWITGGQSSEVVVWRTSGSGARATSFRKKSEGAVNQLGDIGAIDSRGELFTKVFVTELKFHKSLGFECLMKARQSYILKEWEKLVTLAEKVSKDAVMVIKQNFCMVLFCVQTGRVKVPDLPIMVLPQYGMSIYLFEQVVKYPFTKVLANSHLRAMTHTEAVLAAGGRATQA